MYTYAFLTTPASSFRLPHGIAGSLKVIVADAIAAIVEPNIDLELIQQSDEILIQAVVNHDRVLQELFAQATILPLRFGTQFLSKEVLVEHLHSNSKQYQEKLGYLNAKAEYMLKFSPLVLPELDVPFTAKGKDYFLAKKKQFQMQVDQRQQQQVELQQVIEAIAQCYPDIIHPEAKDGIERLYVLLPKDSESRFNEQIQEWQNCCPNWEFSVGEPLPPYHFV